MLRLGLAVLLFAAVSAAVDPLDDLCYRVRWRLSSSQPKQQLVRPVSAFPAEHAKVQHGVCGGNNAGAAVRHTCSDAAPRGMRGSCSLSVRQH